MCMTCVCMRAQTNEAGSTWTKWNGWTEDNGVGKGSWQHVGLTQMMPPSRTLHGTQTAGVAPRNALGAIQRASDVAQLRYKAEDARVRVHT